MNCCTEPAPAAKTGSAAPATPDYATLLLHNLAANEIWLELAGLAIDLLAWTQHLALTGTPAKIQEPERMRLRLLNTAGRIIESGRQKTLRLPSRRPWHDLLLRGHNQRATLTN